MGFSKSKEKIDGYRSEGESRQTLPLGDKAKDGPIANGKSFFAIKCILNDAEQNLDTESYLKTISARDLVTPLDCQQRPFTICRLDNSRNKQTQKKESKCIPGWCEYLGNCYAVTNISSSHFQNVRSLCQETPGADLISIHSQAESDFAMKLWRSQAKMASEELYVGLHSTYASKQGSFVWADETAKDFINWAKGQPDNGAGAGVLEGRESCVSISADGWKDIRCDSSLRGMCKLRLNFDKVQSIADVQVRDESDFYCEPGWLRYESLCFKLHTSRRHYKPQLCASDGHKAEIAYIADELTNAFLQTLMAQENVDEAWIGYAQTGRHTVRWQSEHQNYYDNVNRTARNNLWKLSNGNHACFTPTILMADD